MTRWKRERPETLIMVHSHNQWSNWRSCLLDAAAELNIPVVCRVYPNHYDGSRDEEYLVPAGLLDRIHARAHELHEDIYA